MDDFEGKVELAIRITSRDGAGMGDLHRKGPAVSILKTLRRQLECALKWDGRF
jgi:hypothetical protein